VTEPRIVETARGPIEVAVLGSGPALLIAHGMPGSWQQAVAIGRDLEAERTVVLVTRPGYGGTPLHSGRSAADQADLFAALLDALGIDRTTIVGISGGGPSALAFAQRHPGRTSGLVLLCALAAHVMHVPGYAKLGARLPGFVWGAFAARERRNQRKMLDDAAAFEAHLRTALTTEELARFDAEPHLREAYAAYLRSQCTGPSWAPGFRNDVRAIVSSGRAPTDAIVAPTLVVHGDADTVVPIANAEHHAAAIEGARLHVLPGGTHGFPLLDRATTVDLLRSLP
jgi:pimeloyl-ACP methyl ester carboxylesterase